MIVNHKWCMQMRGMHVDVMDKTSNLFHLFWPGRGVWHKTIWIFFSFTFNIVFGPLVTWGYRSFAKYAPKYWTNLANSIKRQWRHWQLKYTPYCHCQTSVQSTNLYCTGLREHHTPFVLVSPIFCNQLILQTSLPISWWQSTHLMKSAYVGSPVLVLHWHMATYHTIFTTNLPFRQLCVWVWLW